MGAFTFVDEIAEGVSGQTLTAFYTLTGREEFLRDHFEGFPVMPGVLMIEALKQTANAFLAGSGKVSDEHYRLASVEGAKFGQFVKPESRLKVSVRFLRKEESVHFFDGQIEFANAEIKGQAHRKVLTDRIGLVPVE